MTIRSDYLESISRVVKFVDDNLTSDLSVERLADVALFSKYHFSRIFKGALGETVNAFVVRRRLERAAQLLKRQPTLSVTEAALRVGFNSPEHFSRSFKEKFGCSALEFKHADPTATDSLKNRTIYQEVSQASFYHIYQQSREMEKPEFDVYLREQPTFRVASITDVFGDDGSNLMKAYNELVTWAQQQALNLEDETRFAISRDDIEITPAEKYRLEFCISAEENKSIKGRIQRSIICGGTYAFIHVQGDIHRVAQAWDHLYQVWLPSSRYRPRDEPAVEIFLQGPETIGWEQFDLEVGLPVE